MLPSCMSSRMVQFRVGGALVKLFLPRANHRQLPFQGTTDETAPKDGSAVFTVIGATILIDPLFPPRDCSYFKMIRELKSGSKNLLQVGRLLEAYVLRRGVCSMSGSVYDTAWVSMVAKSGDGKKKWLFPQSFQCVLDGQSEDGGWEGGDAIDEIVNTLACLLALKRHEKVDDTDLGDKVDSAIKFVTAKLADWDVSTAERVAFEILIPSLLDQLEKEGVTLQFPDLDTLRSLNQQKMAKLNFELLYKYPSTILHSLESFVGVIDFDKVAHHLREGSMMGSPSSTAAYLMHASMWDSEAEQYLRDAVDNGRRVADGMVTNVFPISTFEFAWSTCNILENGLEVDDVYREKIGKILSGYLDGGNGLVGFGNPFKILS
jgi:hypothetical protein